MGAVKAAKKAKASDYHNGNAQLYLAVPFAEKDQAKGLGARWDTVLKKWYAPHGIDLNPLQRWWPDELKTNQASMADKKFIKAKPKPATLPTNKATTRRKPHPPLKDDRSTSEIDLPWD